MSSQLLSDIFFRPRFGDLTPSDSSSDQPAGTEAPTPSPLTLSYSKYVVEPSHTDSGTSYGLNLIEGYGPDSSQDHLQVLDVRLDALPSISAEGSLYSNDNLVLDDQKILPGLSHLSRGETEADYTSSHIDPSIPAAVKEFSVNLLDFDHLTKPTSPLDPDLSQTPSPEVAHSGFSHRIDLESCEGLPSLLPESFKSTGGQSDDILSRPVLNVEKENQETDIKLTFSINPENLPDAAFPPVIHNLQIPDPYTKTTVLPLAEKTQSHENATIRFVSHHSDVSSSSPIVQTEYSQSDPYFTPATIFRAHSPDIRKNVVGTPELNSSSPPSSPSMTSNYVPSSSSVPSSSPTDRTVQTSPISSPTIPGELGHGLPESYQEGYYPPESYASFSHYPMDQGSYHPLHQHASNDFFGPDPQQHSTAMSQPLMPTSFVVQNYLEVPELPKAVDPYPPPELNIAAAEPLSPTPGPSIQKTAAPVPTIEANSQSQGTKKRSPQIVVPNPKRPTLAGVRQQQKKLSKPFRSPVIHAPVRLAPKPPAQSSEPLVSSANSAYLREAGESLKNSNIASSSSSQGVSDGKMKHRTTKAAAQFKSPLPSSSSTNSDEAALVRLTPTIQSLERKLQLLRRALKVREDVEEEVLEGLVNKWSEAGKEVAREVWDAVKDNGTTAEESGSRDRKGKKRVAEESWGWDESGDSKKQKRDDEGERNWGWNVLPVGEGGEEESHGDAEGSSQQEEEVLRTEETVEPSLGTMLLQLGIAPETFGWSEEEGDFVDTRQY